MAAQRKTYTEELIELKLAIAPVPEIKEDVKELVRAIKGHNGQIGLSARVAQLEKNSDVQSKQLQDFKHHYEQELKDTKRLINDRFDNLSKELQNAHKERIAKLEEEEDQREQEQREIKKDWRKFWIGLGLGLIPQIVDWILNSF